ncbi:cytochrome P450 [Mycobacterium branderi]|uniref:Cytochrome P450 steroid C27-monooxygenase n=1 Tax=Mycobacterium branderi TaxID=43348 RepID=A0A7I7WD51_9MYCO|nr:cytochrome P450 [Mycobacterium branderi]MCV7231877.1 cytochrome P450 [Mycobacterium branderi]ORA40183.1 hypothetical protein BST20_06315 [Mycobacterium branderi]BBZ15466.1 cytochrome P450 steroid C27-monooxygenase [Mycobacterium branderi]
MPVTDVDVDLSNEQFGREIPFEAFAKLRESAPVFWYEPDEYWVVSSYELVREANRNAAVFSSWAGPLGAGAERKPSDEPAGASTILTMDPPKHTLYRRLVNGSFTPRAIAKRESMIRSVSREILAAFAAKGGGDWVEDVAGIFPFRVMGELMGISRDDEAPILRRLNQRLIGDGGPVDHQAIAAEDDAYADRLIEQHRSHPRGDLVDQLLEARVDGQPLTQEELRAWVNLYIGAGGETTKHLIANGLVCLLEWPEARRAVIEGGDLVRVVEELLRFVTPVLHHSRWPLQTVEIGGKVIQAGQRTTLWMISANRDETAFSRPNEFDITRNPNPHDTFGPTGPHFCLGAGLARLEIRVFLEELSPYLEAMELTRAPTRACSNVFNALATCPVVVN